MASRRAVLGHFFNGCASRAERGLEISTLAVVEVTRLCALTLAVAQTPPGEDAPKVEQEETRVDFYTQQLRAHRHRLPPGINIDRVLTATMRRRNILMKSSASICTPSPNYGATPTACFSIPVRTRSAAGTTVSMTGKVNFQTLSRFEDLGTMEDAPHLHLYTAVVWHKTLKRRLRLVVLLNRKDPAKPRFIVLGSTDPNLYGRKLVELYAARFQIEFLFRDSKQFTGLLDCQARAASALDFHFNASRRRSIWYALRICDCSRARSHTSSRWPAGSSVNATNDCSIYL